MANQGDFAGRDQHKAILDKLVSVGWIKEWGFHKDNFAIIWTDKGKERAKWMRTVSSEVGRISPNDMVILAAICILQDLPS